MAILKTWFWNPAFDVWQVVIRLLAAVIIGALIGNERAKHGRAAGMRTHILVCIGAALTSMTSLFGTQVLGLSGDVYRIAAQVISGVGFLGAGMIILKSGNIITGLTTAAGVWTTGVIGVALGYGFYLGALITTVLFMISVIFFAKLEKSKKETVALYIELDDTFAVNTALEELKYALGISFDCRVIAPKSGAAGHVGLSLIAEGMPKKPLGALTEIEHVVFAVED